MALDYVETSKKIIEAVGGAGNISSAGNCMTRLRLVLKDDKKANDEKVQSIKGVKGVMRQGGQYQIIIGNEVSNLFKEFKKHGNWGEDGGGAPQKAEGNPVQRLFGFVSGCMTPMLPAMLGTGMLKVVLTLLTTFCGMSTESSTYILLFSFADCFFMFLPVFLGMTIAKKMGGSPMLFMVVGAALCYPNLISLMGGSLGELGTFLGMPCTYLFGIPVICATYTSSVLPMLLMAPVMKWAEDFADRVSPNVLKAFLKPLLFIIICIPCSLYVLGPIGNVVGNLLSNVFMAMYNAVPWLTVGILSAAMPFIVMYHINAPCDGTISTFFDTGHAFGLTADSGVEFLIRVGMDTIKLNGKGFTPMVKEGDRVKKGQLLLKFDIAYIKSQGLPVTTPVVVSNTDDFSAVDALASGKVDLNTKLLQITK